MHWSEGHSRAGIALPGCSPRYVEIPVRGQKVTYDPSKIGYSFAVMRRSTCLPHLYTGNLGLPDVTNATVVVLREGWLRN